MTQAEITVAGTSLPIIAAEPGDEHIESILFRTDFLGEQYFRIFDKGIRPHQDRYSYEDPRGGRYSHPTLSGARRMIAATLVDLGSIAVPKENQHLCQANMKRLNMIQNARGRLGSLKPLIGDIVMIEGKTHRVANCVEYGAQTSKGGSINIGIIGQGTFSGTLDASRLYECFRLESKVKAVFWMWDAVKGIGGGNGVYVNVIVNQWVLQPFKMSREDAEAHPAILRYRKIFADYQSLESDIEIKIQKLMQGFTS